MTLVEKIAALAGLFSDHTRISIMYLLSEKHTATTMDIATSLGIPQPRVSTHLAVLLRYGLVTVVGRGRHRLYTLDSRKVDPIMRSLSTLASSEMKAVGLLSAGAAREVKSDTPIRRCRTCYDHLAGVVGINLLSEMIHLGWLYERRKKTKNGRLFYDLTQLGSKSLKDRKVDLESALRSKRTLAYGCLDWTERQPHLGGSLGSAVLSSILSYGIAERMSGTRALRLRKSISDWIDS